MKSFLRENCWQKHCQGIFVVNL